MLRTRLAAAERRLLRLSEPERLPERPAVSALMLLLLLRRCCCGAQADGRAGALSGAARQEQRRLAPDML
jgi:hypothetical protein